MKTKLLSLLLLAFTGTVSAQDLKNSNKNSDVPTLTFDFATKKFGNKDEFDKLRKGNSYQIKVTNVNLNNYKVTILNKDSIIATNVTSFPVFDLSMLGGIDDLLGKIDINTLSSGIPKSVLEHMLLGSGTNQVAIDKAKDEMEVRINSEKKELEKLYMLLRGYNARIEDIAMGFQYEYLKFRVNNIDVLLNELNNANKDFKIGETLKNMTELRKEIKSVSEKIAKQKLDYLEFASKKKYSEIMKLDDFKKADENLQSAFERSIKDADTVLASISYDKIASWLTTYIDFVNNKNNNEYVSAEQRISDDVVKTTITFTPIPADSKLDAFSAKWEFPKKSKMFIGLSMSFYYANLKDEVYSTKATVIDSDNTEYRIVNEKNNKGEMGIVSLIHLGWKPFEDKFRDFGFSLVTGPALSLTKEVKPRIAFGGGIAYGEKNMFTLNVLYMGGYVKKLSQAYTVDDVYNSEPNPTVSKLNGALAFSLGYIYKF